MVKDRLVFMTEIPCTDDFVQKSLCGERLPVQRDVPEYGTTVEYTCTLLLACVTLESPFVETLNSKDVRYQCIQLQVRWDSS